LKLKQPNLFIKKISLGIENTNVLEQGIKNYSNIKDIDNMWKKK